MEESIETPKAKSPLTSFETLQIKSPLSMRAQRFMDLNVMSQVKSPGTLKALEHLMPSKPGTAAPPHAPLRSSPRKEFGAGMHQVVLPAFKKPLSSARQRRVKLAPSITVETSQSARERRSSEQPNQLGPPTPPPCNQKKNQQLQLELGLLRSKNARLERDLLTAKQEQARAMAQTQVVRSKMNRKHAALKEELHLVKFSLDETEQLLERVENSLSAERNMVKDLEVAMAEVESRVHSSMQVMKKICVQEMRKMHALLKRQTQAASEEARETSLKLAQRYVMENQILREEVRQLEMEVADLTALAGELQDGIAAQESERASSKQSSQEPKECRKHKAEQVSARIGKRLEAISSRNNQSCLKMVDAVSKQKELEAYNAALKAERNRYRMFATFNNLNGVPWSTSRSISSASQSDNGFMDGEVSEVVRSLWEELAQNGILHEADDLSVTPDFEPESAPGPALHLVANLARLLGLSTDCQDYEVVMEVTRLLQEAGRPAAIDTDEEMSAVDKELNDLLVQRCKQELSCATPEEFGLAKTKQNKTSRQKKSPGSSKMSASALEDWLSEDSRNANNWDSRTNIHKDVFHEVEQIRDDASGSTAQVNYASTKKQSTEPNTLHPLRPDFNLGEAVMYKTLKFNGQSVMLSLYAHDQCAEDPSTDILFTVTAADTKRVLNVKLDINTAQLEQCFRNHPEIYTLPTNSSRLYREIFGRIFVEWVDLNSRSGILEGNSSAAGKRWFMVPRSSSSMGSNLNSSRAPSRSKVKRSTSRAQQNEQMNVILLDGPNGTGREVTSSAQQLTEMLEREQDQELSAISSLQHGAIIEEERTKRTL